MKQITFWSCLLFAAAHTASADVLAQWTFETSLPAFTGASTNGIIPEVGTGSAGGTHASSATVYSTPSGNGSAHSFSANTWALGDYYQFQTSTLGFSGTRISYDQTSSATGPTHFQFSYSTDGSTFTPFVADYTVLTNATSANNSGTGFSTTAWGPTTPQPAFNVSLDLSSITALDNISTAYFRVVDNTASSPSGGTDRIDNFTISATPVSVPEPSVFVLSGLGLAALLGSRKLRR